MWRSRLVLAIIALGILISGIAAWYENEHNAHTAGYNPQISITFLVILGIIEVVKVVQESARSKGRLSGQDFLEAYTALLTNAIEALQDVHTYNELQRQETQTKILKLIGAVIVLFHPEIEGLGINANLMQNEPVDLHSESDKFGAHVYFADPVRGANSYASVLCVKAWADPPQIVPDNFALPVDKDQPRVLFGAPRTFLFGKESVIPNIHNKKEVGKLLSGQPEVVRDQIHHFFERQQYKTFMSIAVKNSDRIIAVLNIQSDQLHVFGNQTRQEEIKQFIDPFCTILGIIVSQSQKSAST